MANELKLNPHFKIFALKSLPLVLMLIAASVYFLCLYQVSNITLYSLVGIFIFTLLAWLTLGGTISKLPSTLVSQINKQKWILPFGHIALCLFVICSHLFWLRLSSVPSNDATFNANLGPTLNACFCFLIFLSLLIAGYSSYCIYIKNPVYFTLITHTAGVIAYSGSILHMLHNLYSPDNFHKSIMLSLAIYGASILLTVFYALFIKKLLEKVE